MRAGLRRRAQVPVDARQPIGSAHFAASPPGVLASAPEVLSRPIFERARPPFPGGAAPPLGKSSAATGPASSPDSLTSASGWSVLPPSSGAALVGRRYREYYVEFDLAELDAMLDPARQFYKPTVSLAEGVRRALEPTMVRSG